MHFFTLILHLISHNFKVLVAGGMQDGLTSTAYYLQAQPAYIHRESCENQEAVFLWNSTANHISRELRA
ncbi:hypothetical protein GCK32_021275 [Trichostrongylus colubriformis]|uniref:Uncharacterized protein n=1 Tax=Trichostrongylus colubriformis TaxID=6319 RepID=A0AAN8FC84_TRICO